MSKSQILIRKNPSVRECGVFLSLLLSLQPAFFHSGFGMSTVTPTCYCFVNISSVNQLVMLIMYIYIYISPCASSFRFRYTNVLFDKCEFMKYVINIKLRDSWETSTLFCIEGI